MKLRRYIGKILIYSGLVVGGITGVCFLLLMVMAVGIGMGGGLRNGSEILLAFKVIGGLSALSLIIGTILCCTAASASSELDVEE